MHGNQQQRKHQQQRNQNWKRKSRNRQVNQIPWSNYRQQTETQKPHRLRMQESCQEDRFFGKNQQKSEFHGQNHDLQNNNCSTFRLLRNVSINM